MVVALQTGGLMFNGLNVMMTAADPTYGYRLRVMSDDTEFGDPEAVIADVQSQLQDGDLQRVDRFGNRTATLTVKIDAPDSDNPGSALAAGQRVLELAANFTGWAELAWTSPLAGAQTSVMEMTSAVPGKPLDTGREMGDGSRMMKLTIGARPFVRPATEDTFDAPAVVGSTTTSVDSGSATTGWSLLSTTPAPARNYCPNPSFETSATGWTAGPATASVSRDTTLAYVGAASLTVFGTSTTARSYAISPAMVVTAGSPYRVYFVAINGNGALGGIAIFRYYSDTAGTVQIGSDASSTFATSTGWGGHLLTPPTAPAGAVRMRVQVGFNPPNTGSLPANGNIDAFILTDASNVITGFFDGATTDTTAINYTWDGTANVSTSTGTWTAQTLAVVSGAVRGTVYGRASAAIRRTGAVTMTALPYMRIKGTASAFSDGLVTVSDNGGAAITPASYSYSSTSGAFEILLNRPTGFTAVDITFTRTGGTVSTTAGLFVSADQIDITDNPFSTGKVQSRQVPILGSQRTELSLSILGLDAAGTAAVGVGEQVLVHTAAAGDDGRAKFLDVRATGTASVAGTAESTAVSGFYNTLTTTAGTLIGFTFPASALLNGNYVPVVRVMPITAGNKVLSYRGFVDPAIGDNVYDPPGAGWKTCPLAVGTTGWPTIALNAWGMLPLGMLRLPPADLEDPAATITIQVAADANTAVRLDDVFLLNADVGQSTLIRTDISGGSYSAVRLDAATVDAPNPSVWVGVANGIMLADPTRIQDFNQHQARPGLLQVSSVTPNCSTSRLAGSYFRRYGFDVADEVA